MGHGTWGMGHGHREWVGGVTLTPTLTLALTLTLTLTPTPAPALALALTRTRTRTRTLALALSHLDAGALGVEEERGEDVREHGEGQDVPGQG